MREFVAGVLIFFAVCIGYGLGWSRGRSSDHQDSCLIEQEKQYTRVSGVCLFNKIPELITTESK